MEKTTDKKSSNFIPRLKSWFKKIAAKISKSLTKKKTQLIILLTVIILVGAFFLLASFGFVVYYLEINSPAVAWIVKILPYPAAVVDGQIVKYSDWKTEFADWQTAIKIRGTEVTEAQLREDVLNKLINEKLLNKLAADYDVEVTADELDAKLGELGAKDEIEKQIKDSFGWTPEQFKLYILTPNIIAEKTRAAILEDKDNLGAAEDRAKSILEKIKNGDDFAQLAKENSADTGSAAKGGDLDCFPRGMMVKEFEDAAFALAVGQVSDLVKTDYGYHIIKVTDKKPADAAQKIEEQVCASHILISPKTLDEYMSELLKTAKVWRFIKL
jgi:foldase protein PrsA